MVPEVKICVNLLKPQMKGGGISPHYEKYITGSENETARTPLCFVQIRAT